MALTKEDLQAIRALMEAERVQTRQMIQEENATLAARLDRVEESVQSVEENIQVVRTSQIRLELEELPRIASALDGVVGGNQKNKEQDNRILVLENKTENQGNRILALEYALKAK